MAQIISVYKLTHDTGPSRLLDVSVFCAHVGAAVTERQLHNVDVVVGVDEDGVERPWAQLVGDVIILKLAGYRVHVGTTGFR